MRYFDSNFSHIARYASLFTIKIYFQENTNSNLRINRTLLNYFHMQYYKKYFKANRVAF